MSEPMHIIKPMLFNGSMVPRLLDGSKTQTRRMVKPQPVHSPNAYEDDSWIWNGHHTKLEALTRLMESKSPHPVGSRIWCKETFARVHDGLLAKLDPEPDNGEAYNNGWSTVYRADGEPANWEHYGLNWKPSIFMPRKFSRITLEVTAVRVQRLQDISDEDALAEGIVSRHRPSFRMDGYGLPEWTEEDCRQSPIDAYRDLWNSINGPKAWGLNPYVFAYTFKKIQL